MNDQTPSSTLTKTRSITIAGGAFTMAAIALVVLADLFLPLLLSRRTSDSILLGLSFGQMGIAAIWACSAKVLTWRRVAVCYLVALIMSAHYLIFQGYNPDINDMAFIATIWLAHPTCVLAAHVALRWFRRVRGRSIAHGEKPPRFGVRHLLIATTVIAVGSLIVRFAVPEFDLDNAGIIVTWILQSVVLALVGIEFRRSEMALYMQLGVLAVVNLVGFFLLSTTGLWDDFGFANVIQTAGIAIALLAPRLDRYTMRITLEPRERETPVEPETAEDLTE